MLIHFGRSHNNSQLGEKLCLKALMMLLLVPNRQLKKLLKSKAADVGANAHGPHPSLDCFFFQQFMFIGISQFIPQISCFVQSYQ